MQHARAGCPAQRPRTSRPASRDRAPWGDHADRRRVASGTSNGSNLRHRLASPGNRRRGTRMACLAWRCTTPAPACPARPLRMSPSSTGLARELGRRGRRMAAGGIAMQPARARPSFASTLNAPVIDWRRPNSGAVAREWRAWRGDAPRPRPPAPRGHFECPRHRLAAPGSGAVAHEWRAWHAMQPARARPSRAATSNVPVIAWPRPGSGAAPRPRRPASVAWRAARALPARTARTSASPAGLAREPAPWRTNGVLGVEVRSRRLSRAATSNVPAIRWPRPGSGAVAHEWCAWRGDKARSHPPVPRGHLERPRHPPASPRNRRRGARPVSVAWRAASDPPARTA